MGGGTGDAASGEGGRASGIRTGRGGGGGGVLPFALAAHLTHNTGEMEELGAFVRLVGVLLKEVAMSSDIWSVRPPLTAERPVGRVELAGGGGLGWSGVRRVGESLVTVTVVFAVDEAPNSTVNI